MIGYKALNKNFTAYVGFKYEIGKTYELSKDEKLEICECGFHFCANPIDVFGYYANRDDVIIVEVEALGDIIQEGTKYATNKIKIIREYSKEELNKSITNKYNTGSYNTGSYNSGHNNTGDYNSGDYNSGNYNSGNYNTGSHNSGRCNSGSYNNGYHNSGHLNTGICNTGNYNTGNYNTGNYNNGNHNAGDYNSGCYNSGCFNTGEPKMRMFNKTCDMTYNEFLWSLDYSFYDLCGRIRNDKLLPGDRERIEALPNYDSKIFTEITGINFE